MDQSDDSFEKRLEQAYSTTLEFNKNQDGERKPHFFITKTNPGCSSSVVFLKKEKQEINNLNRPTRQLSTKRLFSEITPEL